MRHLKTVSKSKITHPHSEKKNLSDESVFKVELLFVTNEVNFGEKNKRV